MRDATSALRELQAALVAEAGEFADVLKMGRTENQDAVPMTLGQEFAAYESTIKDGICYIERAAEEFLDINIGATAVGTGINSPPGYAERCTMHLSDVSGLPVRIAENLVQSTQDSGPFSLMSGAMKTAAVQLSKICNDLRWLSSGPRAGLYEIRLPAMQPGSSIMPGKVNPVLGYERSAAIAKEALASGASVCSLVLEKSWLSNEQLDELLTAEKMTRPR